jgi:hypothetical protein
MNDNDVDIPSCNYFRNIDGILFIGANIFEIRGYRRTKYFRDDTAMHSVRLSMLELEYELHNELAEQSTNTSLTWRMTYISKLELVPRGSSCLLHFLSLTSQTVEFRPNPVYARPNRCRRGRYRQSGQGGIRLADSG